jgi:hypothetical protein
VLLCWWNIADAARRRQFRTRKKNMILDAKDDFKRRTLSALPTLLEKLAYICSLQTETGDYTHWGMNRVFGRESASQAIQAAHDETAGALISVPVKNIYDQFLVAVEKPESSQLLNPEALVLKSSSSDDELLSAHLRLIQNSIASLALQEESAHRAA